MRKFFPQGTTITLSTQSETCVKRFTICSRFDAYSHPKCCWAIFSGQQFSIMAHARVRAHYFPVVASIFIQINLHRESSESQQAGTLRSGLPDSSHWKKSLRLKFMYDWSSLKAGSLDKRTTAVACKDTKQTQTTNTDDLSHKTSAIHSTIYGPIKWSNGRAVWKGL